MLHPARPKITISVVGGFLYFFLIGGGQGGVGRGKEKKLIIFSSSYISFVVGQTFPIHNYH